MAMTETQNKPEMTEWDKQVVAHLNNLIELDQAGKLKWYSEKEVYDEIDKKSAAAEERQHRQQAIYHQNIATTAYAV
jgi:hypothetical protein